MAKKLSFKKKNDRKKILMLSLALLGIAVKEKEQKPKKRRQWCRSWIARRNEVTDLKKGANNVIALLKEEIAAENPFDYKNYMRMDEATFQTLLGLLEPHISKKNTVLREAIPASDRLIATLRYLATGETLKTLSLSMRIPHNTLSVIIKEVLSAIVTVMGKDYLKVPSTPQEWEGIASEYERLWNFPHCIGAMDGKHVTFRPFKNEGSFYRNYKNTDSIVLLGVVDAHYRFIMADIGTNGRISDGGVFSRSPILTALQENTVSLPGATPLPNRNKNTPYVLVADEAFPLKEYIMKPYRFHGLSNEQKIYNYRLSRARRMIESAFGILCNRFQIFLKHMNVAVEKVELITHASVILHNFLIDTCPTYTDESDINFDLNLSSINRQTFGNRNSNRSREVRQEFQDYFNSNGAVDWQQESVDTHNM